MLTNATILGLFAIIGTAIVAFTFEQTQQRVVDNKRNYKLEKLHQLISPEQHDNDLDTDTITVTDPLLARDKQMTVYRARKNNQPVAAIIEAIAPDGYSGKIRLLVAVNMNGQLAGVRVTEHLETPGLGDAIDANKSEWINIFNGKSLNTPESKDWRVRADGGEFDQITSATITSRAVVKATHNVLKYFAVNRENLFD
jgi:electron transport complex protein RnfG